MGFPRLLVLWGSVAGCLLLATTLVCAVPRRIYPNEKVANTRSASESEWPHQSLDDAFKPRRPLDFSLLNSLVEEDSEEHVATTSGAEAGRVGDEMRFRAVATNLAQTKTKAEATIGGMALSKIDAISDRAVDQVLHRMGYEDPVENERELKVLAHTDRFSPLDRPRFLQQRRQDRERRAQADMQQRRAKQREREKQHTSLQDDSKSLHDRASKGQRSHRLFRPRFGHTHPRALQPGMSLLQTEIHTGADNTNKGKTQAHADALQPVKVAGDSSNTKKGAQTPAKASGPAAAQQDNKEADTGFLDIHHNGKLNQKQRRSRLRQQQKQKRAKRAAIRSPREFPHFTGKKRKNQKENQQKPTKATAASAQTHQQKAKKEQAPQRKAAKGKSKKKIPGQSDIDDVDLAKHVVKQPTHKALFKSFHEHLNKMPPHKPENPYKDMGHGYIRRNTRFSEVLRRLGTGEEPGGAEEGAAFEYKPSPFKHPPPPPVPPPPPPPPPPNFGPGSQFSGYQFGSSAAPTEGGGDGDGDGGGGDGDGDGSFSSLWEKTYPRRSPFHHSTRHSAQGALARFVQERSLAGLHDSPQSIAKQTAEDSAHAVLLEFDHKQTAPRTRQPPRRKVVAHRNFVESRVPHPHDYLRTYANYASRFYPDQLAEHAT